MMAAVAVARVVAPAVLADLSHRQGIQSEQLHFARIPRPLSQPIINRGPIQLAGVNSSVNSTPLGQKASGSDSVSDVTTMRRGKLAHGALVHKDSLWDSVAPGVLLVPVRRSELVAAPT